MECRSGCGACCIAPSISSPIPGMPQGKPAGVRCAQLSAQFRCLIFGDAERPAVCSAFQAEPAICGQDREDAVRILGWLEQATA
ncbi:YkgJ family cysteine cluster protein [Stutzerimonas balearica]|uniref:YkgJ family cysteine cluster protein n=1 Tax=Stutzerimonas balearica TaxID=74829 RepID=A0A9X7V9E5_9GAMM|nr:YkgJ family cysteine cluster protein [Stutzerimonas balearica]MBB61518.1 YkgJ family cysteine cluster protein [Pseudomonas sp.]MBZ5755948.1 YkgJ family cysteine cluster protein [Pseudomonas sp. S5(2021)]WIX04355.1 YkgJ family cysteine cluster protein [Pseudomonas sp. AR5]MBC7198465.1 YkgJ family cysteine cluster protein [Stutzerimonas balearica]MBD3737143.1 YkgJ family cysteine cluster protein [Stutzerimonas balearica]